MRHLYLILMLWIVACASALAQYRVVNFESAHVHPLDITPNGATLLAVNTQDGRLEVFSLGAGGTPIPSFNVAVGLEPVTVRTRSNTEVWVVNQLSDSISVIDLPTRRVRATLLTGDKPADVVFAGNPERAYVSVAGLNQLKVFDPTALSVAPGVIALDGEEPRALARSDDGAQVFVAYFESGNGSSVLNINQVSNPNGPYGGQNPPPNSGTGFSPALNPNAGTPPRVGQIIRLDANGNWRDDNGRNWNAVMPNGRLHDRDVAIIDTATQTVSNNATSLMTTVMALAVANDGRVAAVGTEATNQIRFEPNVKSTFIRVRLASFLATTPNTKSIADLNPHLDYNLTTIDETQRAPSIGDPRGIVFDASNNAWISGMGSNHVIRVST